MYKITYRGITIMVCQEKDKRYQGLIFFPDNLKRRTKMRNSINDAVRDAMYWIERWHIVGGAKEDES